MSEQINDARVINTFHFGHERPKKNDPVFNKPWGTPIPPLQAFGNVTFTQLMDVIRNLWTKAHPEVAFVPLGSREAFNPEIGYIVYSLENKKPSDNNLKPRFRTDVVNTDFGNIEGTVFSQTFDHLIQFTAVHSDPYVAEELIETFEDFMMIIGPNLIQVGVEKFFYSRRVSDRDETRFGKDVASRGVQFLVQLQKLLLIETNVLEAVRVDIRVLFEKATPDTYSIMYMDIPYPPATPNQ